MAARPWYLPLVFTLITSACTAWKVEYRRSKAEKAVPRGPVPTLVGKRCTDATCRCRSPQDGAEDPAPGPGKKRIEIRLSATNGRVALDSPSVGHFQQDGPQQACYYVDLDSDAIHEFHLDSREDTPGGGVVPYLHISEYGPSGPYWYEIVEIACGQGARSCDLELAREWADGWLAKRKRGRLDPCGSMVVSGLRWTTSGGEEAHKGGLLRDFEASFSLDVKKYATQFPPGASECWGLK